MNWVLNEFHTSELQVIKHMRCLQTLIREANNAVWKYLKNYLEFLNFFLKIEKFYLKNDYISLFLNFGNFNDTHDFEGLHYP